MLDLTWEDNMAMMKRYPDKHFDLAPVDPPYFEGPNKKLFYGSKVSKIGVQHKYTPNENWDLPTIEYWNELVRVTKYYICFGCNYFRFPFHSGRIVWDKCNGASDYSDCELAATNLFDHTRMFRFMWNGMQQGKSISQGHIMQGNKKLNEVRIHATQKPVALYKWILMKYAKPGYKILDTHLGSGSIAIACQDMGFDLTACEINKNAYDDAMDRVNQHKAQLVLF